MAASATFALNAELCVRRARLAIVTPDLRHSRRLQAEAPLIDLSEFGQPALFVAAASAARAQDIEPRAYSNAPVGVNFLVGGYAYTAYTQGSLATDPSVPLTNAHLATHNA